jgi:pantothenate kinase
MRLSGRFAGELLERARALVGERRRLLGITGPPGSGKSTLATWLAGELAPRAAYVPMDGFHLANRELARLGLTARKGSPPSFDSAGFANALQRIAARREGETVYLPSFAHGGGNDAVAGAIPIAPDIALAVVEGNYLLLDDGAWRGARAACDEIWYVDLAAEICRERLVKRHIETGREPEDARAWVESNDMPNLRLIEASRVFADLVVDATRLDANGA